MGKIKKGVPCNVVGCTETALRSMSATAIGRSLSETGLQVKSARNRTYLCEKHYKSLKKHLKKARKEDLMRLDRPF